MTMQTGLRQKYSTAERMALSPAALAELTADDMSDFPNDFFVAHPDLTYKLGADVIASRGFPSWFQPSNGPSKGPSLGPSAGPSLGPPASASLRPSQTMTGGGVQPMGSPTSGSRGGAIRPSGAPTYPALVKTGVVPPRVQAGLSPLVRGTGYGGQGVSPYELNKEKAQIRNPSAQTWYSMNPSDRQATLATFKGVGLQQEQDIGADITRSSGSAPQMEIRRRPRTGY